MSLFDSRSMREVQGIIGYLKLESFFAALSPAEKEKLKTYSGEGAGLTEGNIASSSQNQKHFLWTAAINAIEAGDYEYAISLGKKGLSADGTPADQHFVYNALIDAYMKQGDFEGVKRYCLEEVEQFSTIGRDLRRDFGGQLPPSIPCRDFLLDAVIDEEEDSAEAERILRLLVSQGLLTREEAREKQQELLLEKLRSSAEGRLAEGDFEHARSIYEEIIRLDHTQAADIYRTLGDYQLRKGDEQEALELYQKVMELDGSQSAAIYKSLGNYQLEAGRQEAALDYFQKAIAADPLIRGVKQKAEKLAKKLGTSIASNEGDALKALEQMEENSTEWWAKRDLANEYVRVRHYDRAWRLFNEAIMLRGKQGMPCDTIYPYMAKMREREGSYEEALFLYALAYKETLRLGGEHEPPKYLSQGIDRCLKKLGMTGVSYLEAYELVKKEPKIDGVRSLLNKLRAK